MARITIEDCVKQCENRFELIILAAYRARALEYGSTPLVDYNKSKHHIIALKEIAAGKIQIRELRDHVHTQQMPRQNHIPSEKEEFTDDEPDLLSEEKNDQVLYKDEKNLEEENL